MDLEDVVLTIGTVIFFTCAAVLVFYGLAWWAVMAAVWPGVALGTVYTIVNIYAGFGVVTSALVCTMITMG